MNNKEIQRQRMMKYFIDAAKEIIKEDGVKGLTARKVGERAGYSYATIYNYFSDLNTLLLYCVLDYLEDCYRFMMGFKNDELDPADQIIEYSLAYFKYFAENTDMFQLIFLEDLGVLSREDVGYSIKPSVSLLLKENIMECAKKGYIEEKNVNLFKDLIGSSIHGKLLFFIKGRNSESLDVIKGSIENEIRYLIKR